MTNQSDLTDEAVCRELCEKYGLTTTFRHRGKILSTTVDEKAMSALSEAVRMMREKAAGRMAELEKRLRVMTKGPNSLNGGEYERFVSHIIFPQIQHEAEAIRALQLKKNTIPGLTPPIPKELR